MGKSSFRDVENAKFAIDTISDLFRLQCKKSSLVECHIWSFPLHRLFRRSSQFGRALDIRALHAVGHQLDMAATSQHAIGGQRQCSEFPQRLTNLFYIG